MDSLTANAERRVRPATVRAEFTSRFREEFEIGGLTNLDGTTAYKHRRCGFGIQRDQPSRYDLSNGQIWLTDSAVVVVTIHVEASAAGARQADPPRVKSRAVPLGAISMLELLRRGNDNAAMIAVSDDASSRWYIPVQQDDEEAAIAFIKTVRALAGLDSPSAATERR